MTKNLIIFIYGVVIVSLGIILINAYGKAKYDQGRQYERMMIAESTLEKQKKVNGILSYHYDIGIVVKRLRDGSF